MLFFPKAHIEEETEDLNEHKQKLQSKWSSQLH